MPEVKDQEGRYLGLFSTAATERWAENMDTSQEYEDSAKYRGFAPESIPPESKGRTGLDPPG